MSKRPYKYHYSKNSLILSSIIFFLSLLIIYYLSYVINHTALPVSTQGTSVSDMDNLALFYALKDVLIVICSITGTNLLLSMLIEKKSLNDQYDSFVSEELMTNPRFLETIDKNNREKIFSEIEKMDYCGDNEIYETMMESIRNKIVKSRYDFYYVYHGIEINCSFQNDVIVKKVKKKITMRAFDKKLTLDNFILVQTSLEKIEGIESFQLISVKTNNKTLNPDRDVFTTISDTEDKYHKKSQYNKSYTITLKRPLTLKDNTDFDIEIEYISRVPKYDKVYSLRLAAPCNNFDFDFVISDPKNNYKLYSNAFGFQDDVAHPLSAGGQNEVKYATGNWMFPEDGIFVTFN